MNSDRLKPRRELRTANDTNQFDKNDNVTLFLFCSKTYKS